MMEKNVFSVLKSLGFTIDLFSTQGEVDFYLSSGASYFKYRETYASTVRDLAMPVYDDVLLADLADSLAHHRHGPHVTILHTMGSHWSYHARYPPEFSRFLPDCQGPFYSCARDELINAYDNTVLYTDAFLSKVIDTMRDRQALLIYTSDHGESLGENGYRAHGAPKDRAPAAQRDVPFIVWASTPWLMQPGNRHAFERMQERRSTTFEHDTLFDSILDCLGVESPDGGVNKSNSWCG